MAVRKPSKQERDAIRHATTLIAAIGRTDANEAETRQRVERIFERVMGYDALLHLSRERAVHGAGDTEHVDFAIQVDGKPDAPPHLMVELKRVGLDLTPRHLKQASRYAIDAGCEWVLLTNGRDWQLHHVEFGQPPAAKLVERWNLLEDDAEVLADKFRLISLRGLKRGVLAKLWETTQVLAVDSLLKAILSRDVIGALRRVLRRETGIRLKADEIVTGLRKILNEHAAAILQDVEVALPRAKERRSAKRGRRRYCTLKRLVEAGLLKPDSRAVADYQSQHYEAVVSDDGRMLFEGQRYRSPSAAAKAITSRYGVTKANGWKFWRVHGPVGEVSTLDALRQRYVTEHARDQGTRDESAQDDVP